MSLLDIQPVVLVTGISGAGKSTVSNLLASRFACGVHIKGDVFRRMVVSGREEMSATPSKEALRQLQLRYRLAAMTADAYHEAGFSVVLQDIAIGSLLTEYVGLIRSRPLVLVVLAPRADVVASRESARSKSAYQAGAPEATDWDSALRRETPKIGMWIDSSEQEAPETVQAIIDQAPELGQIK